MAITLQEVVDEIGNFSKTIGGQSLKILPCLFCDGAKPTLCYENVNLQIKRNGGALQAGWIFNHRVVAKLPKEPGYLIAIHHAVWCDSKGQLFDVTPFHADVKHHPFGPPKQVLFLLDKNSKFIVKKQSWAPLPSRFFSLSKEENLVKHVQSLIKNENEEYTKLYSYFLN